MKADSNHNRDVPPIEDLVRNLIEIGGGVADIPDGFVGSSIGNALYSRGPENWYHLAEPLSEQELRFLICGLVRFEQAGGFWSGSVSPLNWLYPFYLANLENPASRLDG